MGGDVKALVKPAGSTSKHLPLPLAKRILLHVLHGLAHIHHCGVVHADLKHDNIMFDIGPMTRDDIETFIKMNPARRHPPEESWQCVVQAGVSQPLPLPSPSEAMTRNYMVADFGSAQLLDLRTTDKITPFPLRAPEIILRGPWDTKVDIWAFGCLIFELTTGSSLFKYKPYPEHKLDEPTGHLWQMLCFSCERMTCDRVNTSKLGAHYFEPAVDNPMFCDLKAHPPKINHPYPLSIRNYKVMEEKDNLATSLLMRRCLRLNPEDRATAEELLQDPWFHGAAQVIFLLYNYLRNH
ncbi:uncharacterized protein LACBIDRAFT_311104 [Laccaria bicolor S238N-H82]|uniref:Predicted protein n=1 Tax=Laccaria bicolor (strain S238N-H82 / ATCC MYA-4686) TaxID=486041 RepID=B0CZ90_LACBS|nr:uncharacterized protein LACBIDRAFT_311104 [Laccaria bicolor S238N-H82]EDR12577.1 predicted protein [Laccaria bicolor S238N-H82]|eukprot:XP_001876841.1 predicted protein [Laccaria bicolor S238N-H82]